MFHFFFVISCAPKLGNGFDGPTHSTIDEGWVNDHTFRVIGMGVAKKNETDIIKRKIQAKEAALLMAQKAIIEKFKGARLQGVSSSSDGELVGIAIRKEFGGLLRSGSIIRTTFQKNGQT